MEIMHAKLFLFFSVRRGIKMRRANANAIANETNEISLGGISFINVHNRIDYYIELTI